MNAPIRKTHILPQPEMPGVEAWQAMAAPLAAMPCIGPVIARGAEAQYAILGEVSAFWAHWLERRQQALDTATKAAQEVMHAGETGAGISAPPQAIAAWCGGSVERIAEDGREAQQVAARCMTHLADANLAMLQVCMAFAPGRKPEKEHATPL
ncbi:hypothetical protein [Alkalilacustris brevis]|uniref:hypothetical protein n=1 Tax=Alkalilacustris brevis TaxID=2026338 RepID=UPI000E0D5075|nr:hypothetical protein [Alkalilacustris brevis]